jgi:transposase
MVNKYLRRAHISERKFRYILLYFSVDIDAKTTSELTSIFRNTINTLFKYIRIRISEECEKK